MKFFKALLFTIKTFFAVTSPFLLALFLSLLISPLRAAHSSPLRGYPSTGGMAQNKPPAPLKDLEIKEHLGSVLDLKPLVTDEQGESRTLQSFFNKGPVLMTIVYYNCPNICNFHLNGLFEALNQLSTKWKSSWQLLALSMDSSETPSLAKAKKANYVQKFKHIEAEKIHFLTGAKDSIQKISLGLGFSFRYDEESQQFAHSPVAYALSPEGLISRYLYGVEFDPQTLKLSLLEAGRGTGRGKAANMIDRILLFCYRFNPKENRYSLYALNIMRAGGVFIIFCLSLLLIPVWIRERRKNH